MNTSKLFRFLNFLLVALLLELYLGEGTEFGKSDKYVKSSEHSLNTLLRKKISEGASGESSGHTNPQSSNDISGFIDNLVMNSLSDYRKSTNEDKKTMREPFNIWKRVLNEQKKTGINLTTEQFYDGFVRVFLNLDNETSKPQ